ncbi:MAG: oxidoreductase [Rhodospirillum sp.]|nr:oxidoreductase [Rhodospirillum sp.]MCF8488136.1 oxidoreductase [Rhodospirillum sp.]MCF8499972.1 oxidoreductase [Rhodospirillum sp.]
MFRALYLEKGDPTPLVAVHRVEHARLTDGDVTVAVTHSTINYKDALAITGQAPVVRSYPMIPGIDFAGIVEESDHPGFKAGDPVLCNGWGLGESRWGGLSTLARVSGDWLVPLPKGKTAAWAMALGTAGYTAGLCVLALESVGLKPDMGDILVTGASGGVGSVAIALLAHRRYGVTALTGKLDQEAYLKSLGAKSIKARDTYELPPNLLGKERWAGVIDSCGGVILANALSETRYGGVVAACGLAAGMDLPTSVAPFILRGVSLLGVESVYANLGRRIKVWDRLAHDIRDDLLDTMVETISLGEVPAAAKRLLTGQVRGRLVVDVTA